MDRARNRRRRIIDKLAQHTMGLMALLCAALVILVAAGLQYKAQPIWSEHRASDLLFGTKWSPHQGKFGFLPFLLGTLAVTGVSVAIACPLSILCALYLSEYARDRTREWSKPLIDLLAGIPSVVYGVWGVLVVVPLVSKVIAPLLGTTSSGYSVLAAGIVLSVMIAPIIIHVSFEVFRAIPEGLREASSALGATRWQTTKLVVLRRALPGIIAANVLGLSRAFGETMAVLMVAGNVARIPTSLLDPAYPLPALIANNYGEMLSIPLYDSALLLAALLLFVVVLIFSVVSRIVLVGIEARLR
jgi:phosphate transport system permease protein